MNIHQHGLLITPGKYEARLEWKELVDTLNSHQGIDCHTNRRLVRAAPRTFGSVASWHRRSTFPV
jgi:hypothetical protein